MPDANVEFVDHEGHRIACIAHENEAAGDRLPVIWVHGLTMSVRFWERAMFESIERKRSWYSISLPLHSPSDFARPLTDQTLCEELFAELLDAAINRLIPTGKVHLVGHSLGGFAVMNYAAKFPGRVASIVMVGGFMRGRAKGLEGWLQLLSKGEFVRKGLFHLVFRMIQKHRFCLKFVALSYGRKWDALLRLPGLDATLDTVFPDVKRHSINAQRAFCRYLLDMDLLDELDEIQQPVLVMAGDKDPIIPSMHQIECALRLPNSKLVLFDGVGHLPFAEVPYEFESELNQWLSRHG